MAAINVVTPDLGQASEVVVIDVPVKVGDTIQKDDTIVTLESDKATLDVPASDAGKIKSIAVKKGDKVTSGSILLVLEGEGQGQAQQQKEPAKNEKASFTPIATSERSETKAKETVIPISKTQTQAAPQLDFSEEEADLDDVHAGPAVRRFARELGVNLNQIAGSGPKGRIVKEDIENYVKTQLSGNNTAQTMQGLPSMPVVDFSKFGPINTVPLTRIKKISGKFLQRNWMMVPHVTQFGEADITELEAFRQAQKEALENKKIKLTPLVFVMKAVVATLKAFPAFNSSLDPSGENLIMKEYFHIGVAVDTPDGLVVPVIRDVDQKGLITLAEELAHISEKARNKQLLPQEMQGGCFSISSLGGIGGTAFTPIINAPEVAILGVSQATQKVLYVEEKFAARLMLPLSLSYDHRVIDGADGARFMVHLIKMLSDIRQWLL